MAAVILTDEAKEDLRILDRSAQIMVARKLKELGSEPEKRGQPLGSRLGGNLTGFRKLAVGDRQYRIIYTVEPDGTVCVVWVICERAEERCYTLALDRLADYQADDELARRLRQMIDIAWDRSPDDDTA